MIPDAYLCRGCGAIIKGYENHECQLEHSKLISLYNEFQIKQLLIEENNLICAIIDDLNLSAKNATIKLICDKIIEKIKNKNELKKFIKLENIDIDNSIGLCNICGDKNELIMIELKRNDTFLDILLCVRCRFILRNKIRYKENDIMG